MVDLTTNPKTQKTLVDPVSKVEAIGLARKYEMDYFETCSVGDANIV